MGTGCGASPPLRCEICVVGVVGAVPLSAGGSLSSRPAPVTTTLWIETEEGAAEVVAQLLARGRHVISIRLVLPAD